jgi:hypothetical protein
VSRMRQAAHRPAQKKIGRCDCPASTTRPSTEQLRGGRKDAPQEKPAFVIFTGAILQLLADIRLPARIE